MMKTIVLVIMSCFVLPAFCYEVQSDELTSRYGISHAEREKSVYIVKGEYYFKYLGMGIWDVQKTAVYNNYAGSSSYNDGNRSVVIFIVIVVLIYIILTVCIYNMKGINYACFYFFLAPIALALIIAGIDASKNKNFYHNAQALLVRGYLWV